jgi:N-acetylmuramoyl-L-alanine amidase CwlA
MTIKKNLVPSSKYSLKSPYKMTPEGICVHNTANDASAKNEIAYMVSNGLATSFHFAVDDVEIWQGLPTDRNGWHAGDGGTGAGNRKHIGIEICYSKSGGPRFDRAEINAADLIADLLKQNNWGIDRVKKHQDFSGKYCPHRTLDRGWERFKNMVEARMGGGMSDMYKGLDLSNRESMKTAVNIWYEVMIDKLWTKNDQLKDLFNLLRVDNIAKAVEEVKNRLEQIGRLKDEVSAERKLRIDLATKLSESDEVIKVYENKIVDMQGTIDEKSRIIGEKNRLIADLESKVKEGTVILPTEPEPNYIQLFFKWLYDKLAKNE